MPCSSGVASALSSDFFGHGNRSLPGLPGERCPNRFALNSIRASITSTLPAGSMMRSLGWPSTVSSASYCVLPFSTSMNGAGYEGAFIEKTAT